MAKQSGLGDALVVGGYDLSGDVGSLSKISGSVALLDVTAINASAMQRIGGIRNGEISYLSFFNPTLGQEHTVLSALPRTDQQVMYCRGTTLGNPSACMLGKQIDYNPTRAANGGFTFAIQALSNGYGLEWGRLLTAGLRTDTAATNGTGIDGTAQTAFGAQAYLQVTAFTGTDVTVKIQDSADNVSFADVSGFAFAATTAAHTTQRIATSNTATIRRYLRAVTTTSGGFTSATFSVMVSRNQIAGQVY
jgi:hypothetical protein